MKIIEYIKDHYRDNRTGFVVEMVLIGYIAWTAITKHDQMGDNIILIWNDLSWLFDKIIG